MKFSALILAGFGIAVEVQQQKGAVVAFVPPSSHVQFAHRPVTWESRLRSVETPETTSTTSQASSDGASSYAIEFENVVEAAQRIQGVARRTPVLTNSDLDDMAGVDNRRFFFKVEAMQRTGSFKFRGALSASIKLLQDCEKKKDDEDDVLHLITHSSGNHATALACAAQIASSCGSRPVKATVVMPETAPAFKKQAVKSYGGTLVEVPNVQGAREAKVKEIITANPHYHEVPSSQNPFVMAGQGTICLEWMEQMKEFGEELDTVIIPVGGGGMAAGSAVTLRAMLGDRVKIVLAEPAALDDAKRSLEQGELLKHEASNPLTSVADGLKITLGPKTFPILCGEVDDIFLVSEEQILRATRLIWDTLKVCIEPSAGVGVAVALYQEEFLRKYASHAKNVGIILCGGNVDMSKTIKAMEEMGV